MNRYLYYRYRYLDTYRYIVSGFDTDPSLRSASGEQSVFAADRDRSQRITESWFVVFTADIILDTPMNLL